MKSAHPWLREPAAAAAVAAGIRCQAHTSTAAMLKFFSGRDDENESLLGAVTEGKGSGALMHHFLVLTCYRMILRDCAG